MAASAACWLPEEGYISDRRTVQGATWKHTEGIREGRLKRSKPPRRLAPILTAVGLQCTEMNARDTETKWSIAQQNEVLLQDKGAVRNAGIGSEKYVPMLPEVPD